MSDQKIYSVRNVTVQAQDPVEAAQLWAKYMLSAFKVSSWTELRMHVGDLMAPDSVLVQSTVFRDGILRDGGDGWEVRL